MDPYGDFHVDYSDRTGTDMFATSLDEGDEGDDREWRVLIDKVRHLVTAVSPFLPTDTVSSMTELIDVEDPAEAFEEAMKGIMALPRPLPVPLQALDWKDYLTVGIDLGCDDEDAGEAGFWTGFKAFAKGQK